MILLQMHVILHDTCGKVNFICGIGKGYYYALKVFFFFFLNASRKIQF